MAMARAPDEPQAGLRVAIVTDWYLPRQGGIELHLADLARELAARGVAPQIVTTTPGPSRMNGVAVLRLPGSLIPGIDLAVSPALYWTLRRALAAGSYDLVHAHISVVSPTSFAAVLAAVRLGLPVVVTFHSVLLRLVPTLRAFDRALGWSRWPMLVSAVSERVAAQVRRAAPELDVVVLANGIDQAQWRAAPPSGRRRSDSDLVVAATMRLHRKKRPLALLEAFRKAREAVRAQGRRLNLRIAGEGPERRKLETFIARHDLQDSVVLLGLQPRAALAALYRDADMFVLPTLREAFGLAALEARCAGLPVVAMRAAGAADFLIHERTALLADDDADLARQIARLALDDELRGRLAPPDAGLSRYAWSNVVAAHLDAYRRAIALASSASGPVGATMAHQRDDPADADPR